VIRRLQAASVPFAAAATVGLLAVDVVRQVERGVADAGLTFFASATVVGVGAALAVGRWPERRRMAVLILAWLFVGVAADLGVDWPTSRLAATLWMLATGLVPATYALMVLAYPGGRLRSAPERVFIVLAFVIGLAWMGVPMLFGDPSGCSTCAPRVASLLFTGTTFDLTVPADLFAAAFIALGLVFIALVARRLRHAPPGARVTLLPLALAAVFAASEFIARRVVQLGGWDGLVAPLDWLDRVATLMLPAAILLGIAATRRRRGPVGDLVVALGSARPGEVRGALARTLGDPSLELALWLPDRGEFIDEEGNPVDVAHVVPGRAVTVIGPQADPLAALVHDDCLLGQRPLLEAAGSAARLALENTRLQAQLLAQLGELRASRARLVAAADAERRRLERDLHDGAQQRLLALGLALALLREHRGDPELLDQAEAELQVALRELRDLARGIHPAILSEHGLGAAVRSLTDRSSLLISTRIGDDRYPYPIETAAYFVISEALANVAKHARAACASVSVARANGHVIIEISDDGRGGAAAQAGGGLQGLADRVGALNGRLTIESANAAGTTVRAEIPCASS
jgi:signal transduction histidine kinase